MDLSSTLILILVGAAILGWLAGARDGRALDAFGAGFIGYRPSGWPRGVQEEEPVRFAFSEPGDPDAPAVVGPFDVDAAPEIIELDHAIDDTSINLERITS